MGAPDNVYGILETFEALDFTVVYPHYIFSHFHDADESEFGNRGLPYHSVRFLTRC
jgi:hypothetical protein